MFRCREREGGTQLGVCLSVDIASHFSVENRFDSMARLKAYDFSILLILFRVLYSGRVNGNRTRTLPGIGEHYFYVIFLSLKKKVIFKSYSVAVR